MRLTVPTDLSEITLGQLQELNRLESLELDAIELQKRTIELLTGVDRATIDLFRLSDLEGVYSKLLHLSKKSDKLHKFVTIEGIKYGFHPNLSDISTGEFADLDTLCQDFNENLHLILAILYRKVVKEKHGKYQIGAHDETEGRARLFKEKMPANVVNGAMVFFWTSGRDYLIDSLASLQEEKQQTSKLRSEESGVGTPS